MAAAASNGHISVVKLLIKAGADLDQGGVGGEGPALYAAVSAGNTEIVKMLLDAGASPNACEGLSGVGYAVDVDTLRGDLDQVSLLLAKDTIGPHMIKSAMRSAACGGQRILFEALPKYGKNHDYALECAALAGWNDLVRSLLDESSKLKSGQYSTSSALYEAAGQGSLDTIQILFETKTEAELLASELSEAVYPVSRNGHATVVQYLLDRGADVDKIQDALRAAVECGHLSTAKVLLVAGVKPNIKSNARDEDRYYRHLPSPLYSAVRNNYLDMTRLLLSFGAEVNTRHYSTSALVASIEKNNEEMFNLLREKRSELRGCRTCGKNRL
jgi:ankyrin repeat protein